MTIAYVNSYICIQNTVYVIEYFDDYERIIRIREFQQRIVQNKEKEGLEKQKIPSYIFCITLFFVSTPNIRLLTDRQ